MEQERTTAFAAFRSSEFIFCGNCLPWMVFSRGGTKILQVGATSSPLHAVRSDLAQRSVVAVWFE